MEEKVTISSLVCTPNNEKEYITSNGEKENVIVIQK